MYGISAVAQKSYLCLITTQIRYSEYGPGTRSIGITQELVRIAVL